jgi:hypothetical protein
VKTWLLGGKGGKRIGHNQNSTEPHRDGGPTRHADLLAQDPGRQHSDD